MWLQAATPFTPYHGMGVFECVLNGGGRALSLEVVQVSPPVGWSRSCWADEFVSTTTAAALGLDRLGAPRFGSGEKTFGGGNALVGERKSKRRTKKFEKKSCAEKDSLILIQNFRTKLPTRTTYNVPNRSFSKYHQSEIVSW